MKKLLTILMFLFTVTSINAVKYRSVGSDADFSVYVFDEEYYLVLSFKDNGSTHLIQNTIVKFKLTDGTVLRFSGFERSSSLSGSSIYFSNGYSSTDTEKRGYIMLKITSEQIERLKIGVDIVVINTIPDIYIRTSWTGKNKFGQNLYEDFKKLKDEFCPPEPSYNW